jgi:phosphoribosylaminoimidazole-succinocarboxamide synthase
MQNTVTTSNFKFPGQTALYHGKVRDVYTIGDQLLVMIVSDRISAFDVVLPAGIPYKGQVLNQIAAKLMKDTTHIVPNWIIATPDPVAAVGHYCTPFKVEMVVRGYLAGHAWREYKAGKRTICGVPMPDGLKENDRLPAPIITPTTKASVGHDEDISREEIIAQGIVAEIDYVQLERYAMRLFEHGSQFAKSKGLLLVDTKYEFGKNNAGTIMLIDEIHTPDSSRYFYADDYETRQKNGESQKQLSKEFVREWLMENNFQGKEGQSVPDMSPEFVAAVSERYIELYEHITGEKFVKADATNIAQRISNNVTTFLEQSLTITN